MRKKKAAAKKRPPLPRGSIALMPTERTNLSELLDVHSAALEATLGGRTQLVAVLATAPGLPSGLRPLLAALADPRFDQYPLGTLCVRHHLEPSAVFAAFEHAVMARGHLEALTITAKGLSAVAQAVVSAATKQIEACWRCDGTGKIPDTPAKDGQPKEKDCTTCWGKGKIVVPADPDAQTTVLKLAGLLKESGITVNAQQQNLNVNAVTETGAGSFEQMQAAVARILKNPTPVVDGSVVDPA